MAGLDLNMFNQGLASGALKPITASGPQPLVNTTNTALNLPQAYASGGLTYQSGGLTPSSQPYTPPTSNNNTNPNINQQGVLGINTNNVTSAQDQLKAQINASLNNLLGQYDQQANQLPGWQQQDEGLITNTYNNNLSGLNDSLGNANKSLDLDKQQVQTGVDKSVSDIANSLRSLLKNAQGQIGALGAGNSSVAQQLIPYAFSKMYAQQRGNIQGQANQQFTDLAKKGLDVQNQFNTQKMQLDQWENDSLMQTRDKYRNMLSAINNARANATGARDQQLIALQQQVLSQAQSELSGIQNEAAGYRQMVAQAALNQGKALPGVQQQIMNAGTYSVSPLQYQQLTGLQPGATGAGYDMMTPFATGKKKDQTA